MAMAITTGTILKAAGRFFVVWQAGTRQIAMPLEGQSTSLHRMDVRLEPTPDLIALGVARQAPVVRCGLARAMPAGAVAVGTLAPEALEMIRDRLRRAAETEGVEERQRM